MPCAGDSRQNLYIKYMDRKELLTKFYADKDYSGLKQILSESDAADELDILARIFIEEKDYLSAANIYDKTGMRYEYGRCLLLSGNLEETRHIWRSIKEDTPATLWGKSLLEFINLYVVNIPSFFQIRAFLEVDLDALLCANLITYCENIANGAHLFAQNNPESYKFIGRVFVNNKYFELAELFLKKAKDVCYIDPEVHFLLAKCYLHKKDIKHAKDALKICLDKGYGYYPAKKLLKEISS